MFVDGEKPLGIPMELAESRRASAAVPESQFKKVLRLFYAALQNKNVNICCIFLIGIVLTIAFFVFTEKRQAHEQHDTVELVIITGKRISTPTNSVDLTDMSKFLDIKNKTSNHTTRKRRAIKRRNLEILQLDNDKKIDVGKAREIIINYNEPCDPHNKNDFCRNLMQKLNEAVIDENTNTPQGKNSFVNDLNVEAVKNANKKQELINKQMTSNAEHKLEERATTMMDNTHAHDFSENDRSSHIVDDNRRPMPILPQHQYPGAPKIPATANDCPLARLLSQYNFPAQPNYYGQPNYYSGQIYPQILPMNSYQGPLGGPYFPSAIGSPLNYGSYAAQPAWPLYRDATATAFDQSRHPQDVGISFHLKTTEPTKLALKEHSYEHKSEMRAACAEGSIPCARNDACIDSNNWCNGFVDCTDASDEANCTCKSRIAKSRICDGYYDCPFGEDEMGCFGCNAHEFSCEDITDANPVSTCFEKQQRCNTVIDCPNGKDEVECNMLAPSLHDKPIFSVSHTQGFLHRNFRGKWYPVCENPYMWAHDACRRETGLLMRPPFIQLTQIDPSFKGHFMNNVHGQIFEMSPNCFNSSAVYVICQDLMCGTRVQTTMQTLRKNADSENPVFGRNKRDISEKSTTPDKKALEPHYSFENELKQNDNLPNIDADLDLGRINRTKREYYADGRFKRMQSRVVGGVPSQPGAWPWMVAIYKDGIFECGGVIISHRWILSAAHCVHKFWEHYYEVQVGMLRRFSFSPQEQNHKVTHVIVNKMYNRIDMRNDLSLLRVAPAILFSRWVRPICLPGPDTAGVTWKWGPKAGTLCTAVGWGATVEHGPDPDHMREVDVPIWAQCKYKVDRVGNEICAGPVEGGKDSCQGDSGGPLLCKNPFNSKQWYMAGIVSHGEGCARANEPGVYTRVSMYVDWIHFHIASQNLPTIKPKQDCPGFKCVSGISKCLPKSRLCNQVIDCLNGEDELDCIYTSRSSNEFDKAFSFKSHNLTKVNSKNTSRTTSHIENIIKKNTPKEKDGNNKVNDQIPYQSSHEISFTIHTTSQPNIVRDTEDLMHTDRTDNQNIRPERNKTVKNISTPKAEVQHILDHETSTTTEINLNEDFWDDEPEIEIEKKVYKIHSKVEAAMSSKFMNSQGKNLTKDTQYREDSSSNEIFTMEPNQSLSKEDSLFTDIKSRSDTVDEFSNQTPTTEFVPSQNNFTTEAEQNESTSMPNIQKPKPFISNSSNNNNGLANQIQGNIFLNKSIENIILPESENNSLLVDIDEGNIHNSASQNQTQEIIHEDNSVIHDNFHHSVNTIDNIDLDAIKQKELPNLKPESVPHAELHNANHTQTPVHKGLPFSELPGRHNTSNTSTQEGIVVDPGKGKIIPSQKGMLFPALVKKKALLPTFFECKRMPQIINFNLHCNHIADCEDGTDELGCSCVDYLATFNTNLLCDGVVDCADGLDEINCNVCNEGYFLCKWSKMCLPFEYVCDGKLHCPEGEDELDCYALTNGQYMTFDADKRPHVNLEGFLTMRKHNSWNVVCEDDMREDQRIEAATHICHYLGFSGYKVYDIKHINIRNELISAKRDKRSSGSNETIHFIHESRNNDGNTIEEREISNPVILPYHCVPNVTRTCMTLYVLCDSTLNSEISSHQLIPSLTSFPIKTSNEVSGEKSHDYLWPWAAKIFIEGRYRCTGVLVDLSWVMLSESCLWDTLLDKDYVSVVLGSKRFLAAASGPFEQIYEVDGKKDIFDSHVTLLHMKEPARYSRMVKPMVMPASHSSDMQRSESDACVAVGQDSSNNTVTVLLEEISSDCGHEKRCFVRHNPGTICLSHTYSAQPWSGIISCRGKDGWFPAASYVEPKGECGFLGHFEAHSLTNLRKNLKNIVDSKTLSEFTVSKPPECSGVRCARGGCIPLGRACDRVPDCEDGRDELEEICEKKIMFCSIDPHDSSCGCSTGQLKCHNGRCISKQLFANGIDECGDGSDEPHRTTCAQYLARVAPNRLCDGKLHCFDRSDEDPLFCKCFSSRTFECPKSNTCVAQDLVCDGIRDCPHGEDEFSCLALAGPDGTPYGSGEVQVRRYGVWHTKCYLSPNHTRSELESICRDLGFYGGHAKLLGSFVQPSFNSNTNILLDPFTDVTLNDQTTIKLRNNDKPMARAVVDELAENCYPVFIECV